MEKIDIKGVVHRCYVKGSKMGFDEDEMHEFKGHLNFTKEQIPPYCHDPKFDRPSRQPITKTINAMLNSAKGGTIYIGVSDDGQVHGVLMSQHKMEHVKQNVESVMKGYNPVVPPHRYTVNFVPVINRTSSDIVGTLLYDPRVLVASPTDISPFEGYLPHLVRTTLAQLHSGHCRLLNFYKTHIAARTSDFSPECGVAAHSEHLFNCPAHLMQLIVQDLWDDPDVVANFLNRDNF